MNPTPTAFRRTLPLLSRALFLFLGAWGIYRFHSSEFLTGFDLVPGGRGDNRMVTAQLEYWHQAFEGHGSFLSPGYFYPAKGVLGYSDAYLSLAFPYHLLRLIPLDLFTAFQICVLLANLLDYLLAFLMLRRSLGFSLASSSLGAFVFAFSAPKFNQWSHTQMQCLFGLPLVLWIWAWMARELGHQSSQRFLFWGAVAGWVLSLQLLTAFYPGWFFLFWAGLSLAISFCLPPCRSFWKKLWYLRKKALLASIAVTLLGFIPLAVIYFPVLWEIGGKPFSEVRMMIPNLWTYLWMGPRHAWWGWMGDQVPALQTLPVEGEMRMGFGLTLTLLGVGAVAASLIKPKRTGSLLKDEKEPWASFGKAALMATLLICLWAFSYSGFSPWGLAYRIIPGASAIRALSRWSVFLGLPLSILFSAFLDKAWIRSMELKGTFSSLVLKGLLLVFAGCVLYEQVAFPPAPSFDKRLELARLERLSEKLPLHSGPFFVTVPPGLLTGSYGGPLSATDIQIDAMLLSAVRGIPTLNGYSGANPRDWGLYKVRSPFYPKYVQDWIIRTGLREKVFDLEIDE